MEKQRLGKYTFKKIYYSRTKRDMQCTMYTFLMDIVHKLAISLRIPLQEMLNIFFVFVFLFIKRLLYLFFKPTRPYRGYCRRTLTLSVNFEYFF